MFRPVGRCLGPLALLMGASEGCWRGTIRGAGWLDAVVFDRQWAVKATEASLGRLWTKLLKNRRLIEPLDLELGSKKLERLLILSRGAES